MKAWHALSKKKPAHDQECLCYSFPGLYITAFWNEKSGHWDVWNRDKARWDQFNLEFWRPLPAPPGQRAIAEEEKHTDIARAIEHVKGVR